MKSVSLLRDARLSLRLRSAGAVLLACSVVLTTLGGIALLPGSPLPWGRSGWLEPLMFVAVALAALSCLVRAVGAGPERMPWALVGAALMLYSIGNTGAVVAPDQVALVPGWDWLMWLSWYVPVSVALVQLLRGRVADVPRSLWLDSVVVGFAVTAAYTDVLMDQYLRAAASETAKGVSIAIAVAYPLGDLLLLGLVTGVLVVHGWRLPRSWRWIVAALALTAFADSAQLAGVLSDGLSLVLGAVLGTMFGWAAWLPGSRLEGMSVSSRRIFLAPLSCSVVVLGVLLYGTVTGIGLAVVLAAISFVALVARVWLLFDDVRRATIALGEAHAEADRLSRTDFLTGTANRRAFGEALNRISSADGGVGLLLVDIDHFKNINDRYGHDAGDAVIVEITRRMSATVRRTDLVGRWGGEEFCVLVRGVPTATDVERIAENIRTSVCGLPVALPDGSTVGPTVSVGAIFLAHMTTLTGAMNAADEQLYAAKRAGRNRVRAAVPVPV